MSSFRPERLLRLFDTLDGMAFAARLACAGHVGRRVIAIAVVLAGTVLVRLASF